MSGDMKSVSELFSHWGVGLRDPLSDTEKYADRLCSQGCLMLWVAAMECWGSDRV